MQPHSAAGIAGHTPISPGIERHGTHLHTIGHTVSLKLLGEEPMVKYLQPFLHSLSVKFVLEGTAGQGVDLLGTEAIARHVIQEEIVKRIRSNDILCFLLELFILRW